MPSFVEVLFSEEPPLSGLLLSSSLPHDVSEAPAKRIAVAKSKTSNNGYFIIMFRFKGYLVKLFADSFYMDYSYPEPPQ